MIGWPKLFWMTTEHLHKPPKDWQPPPRLSDETPAYIEVRAIAACFHFQPLGGAKLTFSFSCDNERLKAFKAALLINFLYLSRDSQITTMIFFSQLQYTTQQDGSALGVAVSRKSMLNQARALTNACNYSEGEIAVCVLDFKRECGLWHAVLTSVFNGMHCIFVPYALMKVSNYC